MSDLEVTRVGDTLGKHFLDEMSSVIGLPPHVCEALLKAGWTLEVARNQPATWTQSVPERLEIVKI